MVLTLSRKEVSWGWGGSRGCAHVERELVFQTEQRCFRCHPRLSRRGIVSTARLRRLFPSSLYRRTSAHGTRHTATLPHGQLVDH